LPDPGSRGHPTTLELTMDTFTDRGFTPLSTTPLTKDEEGWELLDSFSYVK